MHQLAECGNRQQEGLLQQQEQLQRAHDLLARNSKTILDAEVGCLTELIILTYSNY